MRVYIVYNLSIKDACYLWVGYCLGAVHWTELQNIYEIFVTDTITYWYWEFQLQLNILCNHFSIISPFFHIRIFLIIYFNWRLITLHYCGGLCHTLTWISHGCTCVPHPEPPSHLSPHSIPQCHPSAPALSTPSHALNLDWQSISHMIIYMFQCYSLKSSHHHLLP